MEKRFGPLKRGVKKRVREIASTKQLEALLLAVLDAESIDDLDL